MVKLNTLQYPVVKDISISSNFALDILKNNDNYLKLEDELLRSLNFKTLKTFSFNSDGFLSLLCSLGLKGKIAISLGETQPLYEAGKIYEELGFEIVWVSLTQAGKIDIKSIEDKEFDYIFISSYSVDTYMKNDLETIRNLTKAKIISNGSFDISSFSDAIYFDTYKLSGFAISAVMVSNEIFQEQVIGYKDSLAVVVLKEILGEERIYCSSMKQKFKERLSEIFQDDIYFFVNSDECLEFSLHFGLKGIKARELIRTLALDEILITNGEGCSLGLSLPSRVIQAMKYDEMQSRNAISLSFDTTLEDEQIEKTVALIYKRYKQIRVLNG